MTRGSEIFCVEDRWDCLFCGPRKVDQWRQLVKAAEPTLFLTLTKARKTVEESEKQKSLKDRTLQASPRHVNLINLLRSNSFLHFHHP
jgi:hypothetical protein